MFFDHRLCRIPATAGRRFMAGCLFGRAYLSEEFSNRNRRPALTQHRGAQGRMEEKGAARGQWPPIQRLAPHCSQQSIHARDGLPEAVANGDRHDHSDGLGCRRWRYYTLG